MRSVKIERIAVNCVRDFFNHSDVLEDYISQNDREPIWDGDIMIKWENGSTTKVYTQVKGKTVKQLPKKPTYPVCVSNLKNYKQDGGIAYFVVYIISTDECFFYYALLTPMKLQKFIELANGRGQVSIPLKSINTKSAQEFEIEFKGFDINCKRQTSFAGQRPMSLDEALKKGHKINIPLSECDNQEKAIEYILNNPICLYAEINSGDYKSLYPIGYEEYNIVPIQTIHEPVSVGDVVYFNEYTKQFQKDSVTIRIGECMDFTIHIQDGKPKETVNFHRSCKRVSQIVNELKFIQSVTLFGHIKMGGLVLNINDDGNNAGRLNKEAEYWLRIEQLFNKLHISLELDISEFSDRDFGNLELLMKGILDKKEISQSKEIDLITTADVGKYTILLYAEKQKNGKYIIDDFFVGARKLAFAYAGDNADQKLATSMFSLVFNHKDFSSFINVDYNILASSYDEKKQCNPYLTDRANNDMLVLLNTYDKIEIKNKEMLKAAYKINDWIVNTNDKNHELNIVNKMQIIKRERELSEEEANILFDLAEKTQLTDDMKTAIQLLLNNQKAAEYYFNRLKDNEQRFFESLPIYHFWKNKK
jgi:hypothetical protein